VKEHFELIAFSGQLNGTIIERQLAHKENGLLTGTHVLVSSVGLFVVIN